MSEDRAWPAPRTGAERYLAGRLEKADYRAAYEAACMSLHRPVGTTSADDVHTDR